MNKKSIALLFGGRSAEHEISLRSAKNVVKALDMKKYDLLLIGIEKTGEWFLHDSQLLDRELPVLSQVKGKERLHIFPGDGRKEAVLKTCNRELAIDVIFPVLHGTYGEDGTVQGLLKLLNLPFVGAGVLGSSVGMDKDVMKRLLRDGGIPIGHFLVFHKGEKRPTFQSVREELGVPFFVKPCNLGSSVGISRVEAEEQFMSSLEEAFAYDRKIIIEENISGREIECSVLGNRFPDVSYPGEIVTSDTFYSYDAKYISQTASHVEIPAGLPEEVTRKVRELSLKSYEVLCCEGLARVDSFVTPGGKVVINEINTLPGFTSISMYPMLWKAKGLETSRLVDRLIELALERFEEENSLNTSCQGQG